jgi:AcrR family transcriptional regulator
MFGPHHQAAATGGGRRKGQPEKSVRPRVKRTQPVRALGRPPGAVSDETRARIIDAACQCFAEHGYSKTSNRDIARTAGLTSGALYHYFRSKAELFSVAHRYVQSVLLGVYRRAFAEQPTCVAQLCAGLEASLSVTRAHPKLAHFAAIASLEIQRHPELAAILEPDTQGIRGFFAQLIEQGRQRGEIAADVDTEAVVNLVVSSLFGLAWLRSQVARDEEHAAAIRAFQRLLRGALFRTPVRKS